MSKKCKQNKSDLEFDSADQTYVSALGWDEAGWEFHQW